MSEQPAVAEIEVDKNNLYREEVVTDLKVASIRILSPLSLIHISEPTRPY